MSNSTLYNRVRETTTVTSTGTATLLGAASGYQSFAAVGNGNTTFYTIADQNGGPNWEVGVGTYTLSGTTLSRTTVLASSNSGSLVNFTAGTKDVFIDAPASLLNNFAALTQANAFTTLAFSVVSQTQITTAQAGVGLTITADSAVAGSSVAGAAAGGNITLTAGNAAQLTSGNANGGNLIVNLGTGIGTGTGGQLQVVGTGAGSVSVTSNGQFAFSNSTSTLTTLDTGLIRVAAGILAPSNGVGGGGRLQNTNGSTRVVTNATNATATLSSGVLTNLSQPVTTGRTYSGVLYGFINNSVAAEGFQIDFNGGSGTFSTVQFGLAGEPIGSTLGTATSTALGTAVSITVLPGTVDYCIAIPFSGVCNGSGTLIPRFAEAAHTTGTATFRGLSFMITDDMAN